MVALRPKGFLVKVAPIVAKGRACRGRCFPKLDNSQPAGHQPSVAASNKPSFDHMSDQPHFTALYNKKWSLWMTPGPATTYSYEG